MVSGLIPLEVGIQPTDHLFKLLQERCCQLIRIGCFGGREHPRFNHNRPVFGVQIRASSRRVWQHHVLQMEFLSGDGIGYLGA